MAPTKSKKWQRTRDSHLVTSYPRPGTCPRCQRPVLAGDDLGFRTLYDPWHLSQIGEAEALIYKLRVYHADAPVFYRRSAWLIKTEPLPKRGFLIREHRCETIGPQPICIASEATEEVLPDECPF